MNLPHIHLLLNHWPIIGTFIGLGLFVIALATRNRDLRQASYVLFAALAILALPVYLSGNAAAEVLRKQQGWSASLAETHEGAAMLALLAMGLTGIFSVCGLWPSAKSSKVDESHAQSWVSLAVLLSALATAGLMAVAGNTGGNISHEEIVKEGEAPSEIAQLGAKVVLATRYFVIDYSRWVWPMVEDLHFIGLILLIGVVGIISIRTLGFFKQLPLGPLQRLIPLGLLGFVINVVTGFMFFIGMPFFYYANWYFQLKIFAIFIAAAVLVLFYCTSMFQKFGNAGAGQDAPMVAKLVAGASLVLWIVIVIIGRYIPLGESV
ncbi:MAG TPA: hypothetical protein VFR18_05610 [Terriglobia bacterium]|nr:hypothetical protein [Terriglobia bacterium]